MYRLNFDERLKYLNQLRQVCCPKVLVNGVVFTVLFNDGKAQIDGTKGNLISWVFPNGIGCWHATNDGYPWLGLKGKPAKWQRIEHHKGETFNYILMNLIDEYIEVSK